MLRGKPKPSPEKAAKAPEPVAPVTPTPEESPLVQLSVPRPPHDEYRLVIALIDDQGRCRSVDLVLGALDVEHLTEQTSWQRYFLPSLHAIRNRNT
jgi:hypothetical protein